MIDAVAPTAGSFARPWEDKDSWTAPFSSRSDHMDGAHCTSPCGVYRSHRLCWSGGAQRYPVDVAFGELGGEARIAKCGGSPGVLISRKKKFRGGLAIVLAAKETQ